mmetsp:Transcript_34152/g.80545  ORF Transcript_34152/g.80545 Transcript_34152/m.80545 type:complete len:90 (-) Transcript_34152:500-769(-)|eukprot:2367068-Rhodomonas_salina.1
MPPLFRDDGTELPRLTPGEGIGSFHPHWGQTGPALLAKVFPQCEQKLGPPGDLKVVGGVAAVPAADGVGERQGGPMGEFDCGADSLALV